MAKKQGKEKSSWIGGWRGRWTKFEKLREGRGWRVSNKLGLHKVGR